jgi:hypothetical protein
MARQDLSFETLVEVTSATVSSERGALNSALKQIREASPDLDDADLAVLIRMKATQYRAAYPSVALTPTALAKHWGRVEVEQPKAAYPDYSPPSQPYHCATCDNHKLVLVGHEPVRATMWMKERGIEPLVHPAEPGFEQYACCPDCNSEANVDFWRADGSRFTTLDPAQIRARMIR